MNLLKRLYFLIVIALSILFGCATVPPASDTHQMVRFESVPTGANLYIDGKRVGNTPVNISISKATHRITLKHSGYKDLTKYIAPRPRSVVTHLLTLGLTMQGDFDTLESRYVFELTPLD
jgi:predicted component of type VI protein secretion system